MGKFILQRLLQTAGLLLGISLIAFGLMSLTPGDPAEIQLRSDGVQPSPEAVAAARVEMGLDKPLYAQYGHWLWRALHGDLGLSFGSGRPVTEELLSRLPATLLLTASAIALLLLAALPIGVVSALHPGGWIDRFGRTAALLSVSMPGYWLGLLLLYYGAV